MPPQLNGRRFCTYDTAYDGDPTEGDLKGGWWLETCDGTSYGPSGLNGEYQRGPDDRGIIWDGWPGHRIVKCEMKMHLN